MLKNLILMTTLLVIGLTYASENKANGQASSKDFASNIEVLPEYIFTPTDKLADQVEQTLVTAKAEQKLALFVLGAQWCHDSKALAKNFSTPPMQQVLSKNYQVLFVDVGYLEKGFELVKKFKQPIYYGTPTVLVVDPSKSQLLNKLTMQKWLNANKVPLNEYLDYFNHLAEKPVVEAEKNKKMLAYIMKINDFEQQQAIRLKKAYGVVGPLLKAYMKSDNKKASTTFVDKWQPVQDYRYNIQTDINALISQAKSNIKTGNKNALEFPIYPAFAWE